MAALWALPVLAAPEASVADLEAAGFAEVKAVEPAPDGRYAAPVRYFRSSTRIAVIDAKRDCPDCGDLIAVYAARSLAPPDWSLNPRFVPARIVAGRWQIRGYLKEAQTILIVTGPDRAKTEKLFAALSEKAAP